MKILVQCLNLKETTDGTFYPADSSWFSHSVSVVYHHVGDSIANKNAAIVDSVFITTKKQIIWNNF
jgi:hypothetical protein